MIFPSLVKKVYIIPLFYTYIPFFIIPIDVKDNNEYILEPLAVQCMPGKGIFSLELLGVFSFQN